MTSRTLLTLLTTFCLFTTPPLSLSAKKNQAEQQALKQELTTLEATQTRLKSELTQTNARIEQINEQLNQLQHVQSYTRPIYLKLPLTQPRFHWKFLDRHAFLNGTLELVIRHAEDETRTLIFSNGKIHDDWKHMHNHCEQEEKNNEIYFGFISKKHFDASRLDTAEILLTVNEDLHGIGPDFQGILPKGEYRAKAPFTIYDLEPKEGKTQYNFITKDDWAPSWDLIITEDTGWLDQKSPEETEITSRKLLVNFLTKAFTELFDSLLQVNNDPTIEKMQTAFEEALQEIIQNELAQPPHYWENHSPKEIRAKYDKIQETMLAQTPVYSKLILQQELPPEIQALKDASPEDIKNAYKQKLLETLKDVLSTAP